MSQETHDRPVPRLTRGRSRLILGFALLGAAAVSFALVLSVWLGSHTSRAVPVSRAAAGQEIAVEVVARGLATIWAVDFAPDGRIFLTERAGRIRVIGDDGLDPQPWMTLDDVVEISEAGLLGLALDPGFAENGFLYVAYTYRAANGGLQNRLVRLREDPTTARGVFDAVVLDNVRGANNHDGGRVKFGPDGKIYWTMGDGQNPQLAQDPRSWNGKILRVNSDGSIPEDNPFPGSPVYSYGHRNPQGLAWQPGTGRLYATEHGPSGAESCCDEVNYILPGANDGWPLVTSTQTAEGLVPPVVESGRSTWAPAGATFVSQGPWAGSLLFTGLRGAALYRVVLDADDPMAHHGFEAHFSGELGRLREIVEGPDGAFYLATSNRDGRGRPARDDDRLLRITVR